MDYKPNPQQYSAPVGGHGGNGPPGSHPIFPTPIAVTVARGFQLFLGFMIMILGGLIIHGLVLDAAAFGLVCGLFTFIVAIYALVAEKAPACHRAYNYWAIISLDALMAIFWLSSMGANAALRASFVYSVDAECYSDGSALNSGHCITSKRDGLDKRAGAVATNAGLAEMSAIAGLSALEMLLFIGTLTYLAHQVRMHHSSKSHAYVATDNAGVEMKAPILNQQTMYAPQDQPQSYYGGQQQYDAAELPPQHQQQQPYDSYGYSQAQMGPQQQQQQHQQQQQPHQYQQGQTPMSPEDYHYQAQQQQHPQTYTPPTHPEPYHPPPQ